MGYKITCLNEELRTKLIISSTQLRLFFFIADISKYEAIKVHNKCILLFDIAVP